MESISKDSSDTNSGMSQEDIPTREYIERKCRELENCYGRKEFPLYASEGYTTDCRILISHYPLMNGRGEAQVVMNALWNHGVKEIKIETEEYIPSNVHPIERGVYQMISLDGVIMDRGNYLSVWKKEDGEWKKFIDNIVSEIAPQPAQQEQTKPRRGKKK